MTTEFPRLGIGIKAKPDERSLELELEFPRLGIGIKAKQDTTQAQRKL